MCNECFDKKYKSTCEVQDFQINEVGVNRPHREIDNATIRRIIRMCNRSIRFIRYAMVCILIICAILVTALSDRNNLRVVVFPDVKDVRITTVVSERFDSITERIKNILLKERKQDG